MRCWRNKVTIKNSPVGWGCRIRWQHFCRRVRFPTPNQSPGYVTKPSDSEAPIPELWEMWSTLSLLLQVHSDPEWKYVLGSSPVGCVMSETHSGAVSNLHTFYNSSRVRLAEVNKNPSLRLQCRRGEHSSRSKLLYPSLCDWIFLSGVRDVSIVFVYMYACIHTFVCFPFPLFVNLFPLFYSFI